MTGKLSENELFAAYGMEPQSPGEGLGMNEAGAFEQAFDGKMASDEYSVAITHNASGPALRLYSEVVGPLRIWSTDR